MSLLKEFKEFAVKGNVIDLAVGVVIGAAFGKIVSSLVADVIMPAMGLLMGGVDLTGLSVSLPSVMEGQKPAVLKYGAFVQTIIDFTIIAFAIFMLVKGINRFKRKQEEAPAAPPEPSAEEKLLTEIRDLLKAQAGR